MNVRYALSLLAVAFSVLVSCASPEPPALTAQPDGRVLTPGDKLQLTVNRQYRGGPVENVTDLVTFVSLDPGVVSVSDFSGSKGLLTAVGAGAHALVRVHDPASDTQLVLQFDVTAPLVRSLVLTPTPALVVPEGRSRRMAAHALLSNGATVDVSERVLWATSDDAVATVAIDAGKRGLVSGVALGTATITATDPQTGVQGSSGVVVTSDATPTLKAIQVAPNPAIVTVGLTTQFAAYGVYADGSSRDITTTVAWSSSRPELASLDDDGLTTGIAPGQSTVTATDTLTGIRGSSALLVTP